MRLLQGQGREPELLAARGVAGDRLAAPGAQDLLERAAEAVALLARGHLERGEELGPEAAADAEDHAPLREAVENRDVLGDLERVPHGQQVGGGAEPELARARGDRGEQQERLGQRAARAEVTFGQPERIEAE